MTSHIEPADDAGRNPDIPIRQQRFHAETPIHKPTKRIVFDANDPEGRFQLHDFNFAQGGRDNDPPTMDPAPQRTATLPQTKHHLSDDTTKSAATLTL
jgi:hypothetical protein